MPATVSSTRESSPLAPARGVVLAGGAGARLGGAKATIPLAGRALASYPVAAMRAAGLAVAVVAKRTQPLPELGVDVWREPDEPRHPLTGLLEALRRAGAEPIVACACDMPFVEPGLLRWLAEQHEPLVVCRAAARPQPLLARYGAGLAEALAAGLAAGRALADVVLELEPRLVDEADLRRFGDPDRIFFNVNTPADLREAERRLRASA